MKECIAGGGHSFEPRYSETTEPDVEGLKQILNKVKETGFMGDQWNFEPHKFIISKKQYHGDVCVVCGETIC